MKKKTPKISKYDLWAKQAMKDKRSGKAVTMHADVDIDIYMGKICNTDKLFIRQSLQNGRSG